MAIDAQRFMDLVTYLHTLWSAPFQIALSLIFLYQTMGPSVFAGLAVMVLLIPANAIIAFISRKFQVCSQFTALVFCVCVCTYRTVYLCLCSMGVQTETSIHTELCMSSHVNSVCMYL